MFASPLRWLVAAAISLSAPTAWAEDKPEAPRVQVSLQRDGASLAWRLPVKAVAAGATFELEWDTASAPPDAGELSELRIEMAGKSACTLRAVDRGKGVVLSRTPECEWLYRLAPATRPTVTAVTKGRDVPVSLGVALVASDRKLVLTNGKVVGPEGSPVWEELAGGAAPAPSDLRLVPVPTIQRPNNLASSCLMLLDRWEPCGLTDDPGGDGLTGQAGLWRMFQWLSMKKSVYLLADVGNGEPVVFEVGLAPPPPPKAKVVPGDPPPAAPGWCVTRWYQQSSVKEERQLVCVDHGDPLRLAPMRVIRLAADGSARPTGGVLMANVPVTVMVRMPASWTGSFKLSGVVGFETSPILDAKSVQALGDGGAAPPTQDVRYIEASYPSLRAGEPVLTVNLEETGTTTPRKPSFDYRLFVDRRLTGAFRAGLAIGYSKPAVGAPYDRYTTGYAAGSSSLEVVDTGSDAWVNSELTFGLSMFLAPLWGGAVLESEIGKPHPAVYLGMGVLQLSADSSVLAIPAVHGGFELSLGRNVGIGITASARPTKALAEGVSVGDYAASGALPSRVAVEPGVSVLLNMSSDNLAIALGGGR